MGKVLMIVESPTKAKNIQKYLGDDYIVEACAGHICDLPSKNLGIDEEDSFRPHYEVIEEKRPLIEKLRDIAAKVDSVYLASDPDREGEAIAWHLAQQLGDRAKEIRRVTYGEVTKKKILEAVRENVRDLDENVFNAQQARRLLDRLVGYKISPCLWKTVLRGISAGRVQSVALRVIVEREREREAFKSEEYWRFRARLQGPKPPKFDVVLTHVDGKEVKVGKTKGFKIRSEEEAVAVENSLKDQAFVVKLAASKKAKKAQPPAPFVTATLQQEANQRLGFTVKRTMSIAQRLYEGVELADGTATGLITYMRTDSPRISTEAQEAARDFITESWSASYLPKEAPQYVADASAQDAHEAIRPVDVNITPERAKLSLTAEQYKLYNLIWTRFVASQMKACEYTPWEVVVSCGATDWSASGKVVTFDGWQAAYPTGEKESRLPAALKPGDVLNLVELEKEQKFTEPAPRFTEAALVKMLRDAKIGRPSTYATIITTVQDRGYVAREKSQLIPTELGRTVCDQLCAHFADLMDVGFTAKLEEELDFIEEGREDWIDVLRNFTDTSLNPQLADAAKNMRNTKAGIDTDLKCPSCGENLRIKFGKTGAFLACSGYPKCKFSSNFKRDEHGKILIEEYVPEIVGTCPDCGKDLVVKRTRSGSRFIACSGYPECKHSESFSTGVACPRCGEGYLVEKCTRRGKPFYSCDRYPACDFAVWDQPVPESCPDCHAPFLLRKKLKGGVRFACADKECGYKRMEDAGEEDE